MPGPRALPPSRPDPGPTTMAEVAGKAGGGPSSLGPGLPVPPHLCWAVSLHRPAGPAPLGTRDRPAGPSLHRSWGTLGPHKFKHPSES